jgi:hypothetical protein
MRRTAVSLFRWLFDSSHGSRCAFVPRWIFLRALGLIYLSAFVSLVFQIRGLIGPHGILPAFEFLQSVSNTFGAGRFVVAPTLLWFWHSDGALLFFCWAGIAGSLLLILNLWPRGALALCFICFVTFVSAAGDFSSYQSDGMLLEAGFISLFFAPAGIRPRFGSTQPVLRAAWFPLVWEWFRIYFESGIAKIFSGDPEWRHFTALDEYYQNGPLPTWIGYYVQHFPHGFHATLTFATLLLEIVLAWMAFLPRRFRIICFWIVTPWQAGVILTANYTFLNYLTLFLGFLLLDDRHIRQVLPRKWRGRSAVPLATAPEPDYRDPAPSGADELSILRTIATEETHEAQQEAGPSSIGLLLRKRWKALQLSLATVLLSWVFYATTAQLLWMFWSWLPLPQGPVRALEGVRIANEYGLFAVMTRGRYEIEFQGSDDGQTWTAYPFRFKPQALDEAPKIYAPYQPRFDWNLWFASLTNWRGAIIVVRTEEHLLQGTPAVLDLFAGNPFPRDPPKEIRAVIWQYWFTTLAEKRQSGNWWRRELLGLYAPVLERLPDGKIVVLEWPGNEAPRP